MAFASAILPFIGAKIALTISKTALASAILVFASQKYEKFVKYIVKPLAIFLNMDIIRIVISTRIYRVLTIIFALTFYT